jgi:hypothetical protein
MSAPTQYTNHFVIYSRLPIANMAWASGVTTQVQTGLGQVLGPGPSALPRASRSRTLPAGDVNVGPSDFLFTAAADYLLLHIATRHDVGTSAVKGSSFSALEVPGVFLERAAMEDLRQILVLRASRSLQHALLLGWWPTTRPAPLSTRYYGRRALLRCARRNLGALQQHSLTRVVVHQNSGQ